MCNAGLWSLNGNDNLNLINTVGTEYVSVNYNINIRYQHHIMDTVSLVIAVTPYMEYHLT